MPPDHSIIALSGKPAFFGETTKEGIALIKLFTEAFPNIFDATASINNRESELFGQKTPKARILAALHEIKTNTKN